MKSISTVVSVGLLAFAGAVGVNAAQTVRELWDDVGIGVVDGRGDGSVSVGFQPSSTWIANANEPTNTIYIKVAQDFDRPGAVGLPVNMFHIGALWSDNGAASNQYSSGIWAVRQLASGINFNAEGTHFLSFFCRNDVSPWVPVNSGDTMMGVGFADGSTLSANFIGAGVTRNNYIMPDTANVGNSTYITAGTLGQADLGSTTNSGGPCFVRAYSTNRLGAFEATAITILARLTTHVGGNATLDMKGYLVGEFLDTDPNSISWDASYTLASYTGTMNYLLLWMNGVYPAELDGMRVGTTLADVLGIEQGPATAFPSTNVFTGWTLYLTNRAGVDSSRALTYQWYTNGVAVAGEINSYFNVTNIQPWQAGQYQCISTASDTWGSVTSAVLNVSVGADIDPPYIQNIRPGSDLETVVLTFSEQVTGADQVGSYAFTGGVGVNGVNTTVLDNKTVASIKTTTQNPTTKLTVTVTGVQDGSANALSNNVRSFWTCMYQAGRASQNAWAASFSVNDYFNFWLTANTNPIPDATVADVPITSWQLPNMTVNNGVAFGARMSGYFVPPTTGDYVFFTCGDDAVRLALSTNALPSGLCVIACEDLWSNPTDWTGPGQNQWPPDPPAAAAHRGDGSTNSTGPFQNRSDQFLTAYTNSSQLLWPNQVGFVTDVVPLGMPFWPNLDPTTGEAKITLQAGQKYYMQADYWQGWGGQGAGVNYKLATSLDPTNGTATTMTGTVIGANVPFQMSLSIAKVAGVPVITYTGILMSSTSVQGPYTDVIGATSPYSPTPSGFATFYRVHD